ncbi:MAG: cupin-like domain-containing protein [Polyangiaceae bacterium]|jgi:hypothetical protein|nr:cupin-like domain-containing protein [Polyangiaceae bacterium]MBK8939546.1 cupin-like domain-containing protein [Polyangiaceae bacterium]
MWVARNLGRGVSPATLLNDLIEAGVPPRVARAGVAEVRQSSVTPALVAALARDDRAREVASLQASLRATSEIEVVTTCPPAAELFQRYWATNTPLLIRGFVAGWRRRPDWSFAELRRRFGGERVEISGGRDALRDPDIAFAELRRQVSFGELLDLVEGPPTNDAYLVARNRALGEGALGALLDEIEPPEDLFDPSKRRSGVSLWLGPAGTFTKLHHDATNNILTQLIGDKVVRLVAPYELDLADTADGYYARSSAADLERARPGRVREVHLAAGDGLFIPVGWWHEVESLTPSLSLALVNFRRDNDYDYMAGRSFVRR